LAIDRSSGAGVARPGYGGTAAEARPLEYLLGGAVAGLAFLGVALYVAYRAWIAGDFSKDLAYTSVGLAFVGVALGAFVFSYGWERRDAGKALGLTIKLCLGAVLVIAGGIALMALLSRARGGTSGGSGGGSAASSGSDDGFDAAPLIRAAGSLLGDGVAGIHFGAEKATDGEPSQARPFTIACPHCGLRFEPKPPDALCPECGRSALAPPAGRG